MLSVAWGRSSEWSNLVTRGPRSNFTGRFAFVSTSSGMARLWMVDAFIRGTHGALLSRFKYTKPYLGIIGVNQSYGRGPIHFPLISLYRFNSLVISSRNVFLKHTRLSAIQSSSILLSGWPLDDWKAGFQDANFKTTPIQLTPRQWRTGVSSHIQRKMLWYPRALVMFQEDSCCSEYNLLLFSAGAW